MRRGISARRKRSVWLDARFPAPSASSRRFRSSAARQSSSACARCCRGRRARTCAWRCWAARPASARAASSASSPPRRRPAARSCSTARATRSCARPTARSPRRSRRWASCRTCCPGATRSRPSIPTPSATASTPRSSGCSRARRRTGPRCSCSRTCTGRTPRRCCCCATWRACAARASLLLATFRDTEAEVPEALAETLADLRRYDVMRLRLAGLSEAEVAEFVRRAGGHRAERAPAGDPLAHRGQRVPRVRAVAGAAGDGSDPARRRRDPDPPRAARRSAARRACARSSSAGCPAWRRSTVELLELGATAGTAFELEVVRHASGLADAELLPALDEAVRSGMIDEVPSDGLAWRFAHELVRRALYDRLSGSRRAELHLRVGEALEAGDRRQPSLADLAHHFAAAAPFGDAERAVEYNVRAARAARDALAFEDAAALLRTALALGERRAELMLELGQAEHRAGHAPEALEAFEQAAAIARAQGRRGAARPRGDRLRRGVLAAGDARPRRGRAAGGGCATRSASRTRSCASACSAGWRARATCRGGTSARTSPARQRSRWRDGSATTPGSPPA